MKLHVACGENRRAEVFYRRILLILVSLFGLVTKHVYVGVDGRCMCGVVNQVFTSEGETQVRRLGDRNRRLASNMLRNSTRFLITL